MTSWDKDALPPTYVAATDKRNVIKTSAGWVRRQKKTVGSTGTVRTIDEILVTLDGALTSSAPKVVDAYFSNSTYTAGASASLTVVLSEPLAFNAGSGAVKVNISNTTAGAAIVGTCAANTSLITNADNSLVFNFTAAVAGVYALPAQTLANSTSTAVNLKSTNSGTANAVLTVSSNVAAAVVGFTVV